MMVAAGNYHTVGLKSDGTVVAVGMNGDGQCDVGNWTDIIQVAAGDDHTVGLKSDGTVVAVGDNTTGSAMSAAGRTSSRSPQATVTRWGLRPTALWSPWEITTTGSAMSATGRTSSRSPQAAITRWGLSPTALWSPWETTTDGQCDVGGWTDIIQVAAGD